MNFKTLYKQPYKIIIFDKWGGENVKLRETKCYFISLDIAEYYASRLFKAASEFFKIKKISISKWIFLGNWVTVISETKYPIEKIPLKYFI